MTLNGYFLIHQQLGKIELGSEEVDFRNNINKLDSVDEFKIEKKLRWKQNEQEIKK